MPRECKDCFYHGTKDNANIGCSNPQCAQPDDPDIHCTEFIELEGRRHRR